MPRARESPLEYTVTVANESESHPNRQAAIDAAKERSTNSRGEVTVSDTSGHEILTYRHGELASYLWDDRGRAKLD